MAPTASTSNHPLHSPSPTSPYFSNSLPPALASLSINRPSSPLLPNSSSHGGGARKRLSTTALIPDLVSFSTSPPPSAPPTPTIKLNGKRGTSPLPPEGKLRKSLDEFGNDLLGADGSGSPIQSRKPREDPETQVLVHELKKTDTLASISLQYGITPQALRSSNRLWANDSIHLHKTLLIPLNKCHLPSSRVERDPTDGNLILWEPAPLPPPPPPPLDLLMTTSAENSTRSSFESSYVNGNIGNGKGKSRAFDEEDPYSPIREREDTVAAYLRSTNNPYSSSSTSLSDLPPPVVPSPPPLSSTRRTLQITSVPTSTLSYFPPPTPSFSAPSSSRSSFEDVSTLGIGIGGKGVGRSMSKSSSSNNLLDGPGTGSGGKRRNGKKEVPWTKKWDLTYFGGEEEVVLEMVGSSKLSSGKDQVHSRLRREISRSLEG